jgi:hypothetical protein
MKVLTRIDDSKSSKNLVRALVIQFRTENAEILARHVLAPVDPVAPPEVAYSFWLVLSSSLMLPLAELRSLINGAKRLAYGWASSAPSKGRARRRA